MENESEEHIAFMQNLQVIAFKEQIEETFNRECYMCYELFFTCSYADDICRNCIKEVKEFIEEMKYDD